VCINFSLFKPNLINMSIHSATCSCSVELYKLWYTLADFFPNWNFRGVFSTYITNIVGRISAAAMAGDIIFFCLADPLVDYTEAHTGIFRGVFYVRGSLAQNVQPRS
jgi:hypothetical protein